MDERFTRQRGREQSERAARGEAAALRAERHRRMAGTDPNEEGEGEEGAARAGARRRTDAGDPWTARVSRQDSWPDRAV